MSSQNFDSMSKKKEHTVEVPKSLVSRKMIEGQRKILW